MRPRATMWPCRPPLQATKPGPERANSADCGAPASRVIKYYAWENNFSSAIMDVRHKEVDILVSQAYWRYVSVTGAGGAHARRR